MEKVKAVAAVAHSFPCSSPPTVYVLGDFQFSGFWAPQNLQLDGALFPWCREAAGPLRPPPPTSKLPQSTNHIKGRRAEQMKTNVTPVSAVLAGLMKRAALVTDCVSDTKMIKIWPKTRRENPNPSTSHHLPVFETFGRAPRSGVFGFGELAAIPRLADGG